MPLYARFTPTDPVPQQVIGWYDTDTFDYGSNLPPSNELVVLTQAQWDGRMSNPSGWGIDAGGNLVEWTPPVVAPTPAEDAQAALNQPVTVQCTSIPALDANYSISDEARTRINSTLSVYNSTGAMPGGGDTIVWADVNGATYTWPSAQYIDFATQVASYVHDLSLIVQTGSGTLPSSTLVIA
jgi:hypothetical protein